MLQGLKQGQPLAWAGLVGLMLGSGAPAVQGEVYTAEITLTIGDNSTDGAPILTGGQFNFTSFVTADGNWASGNYDSSGDRLWTSNGGNNTLLTPTPAGNRFYNLGGSNGRNFYNPYDEIAEGTRDYSADGETPNCTVAAIVTPYSCSQLEGKVLRIRPTPVDQVGPSPTASGTVTVDTVAGTITGLLQFNDRGDGSAYAYRTADGSPFNAAQYLVSPQATLAVNWYGNFSRQSWQVTGGQAIVNDPGFTCTAGDLTGTLCNPSTILGGVQQNGSHQSWFNVPIYNAIESDITRELQNIVPGVVLDASLSGDGTILSSSGEFHRATASAAAGCVQSIVWDAGVNRITCGSIIAGIFQVSGQISECTADCPGGTAQDDSAQTAENQAVTIDVLANDAGFLDPVEVTITTQGLKGTAVVNGSPGSQGNIDITYTPDPGATGQDSFQYQVADGGNTDTATVTLTINAAVANDDVAQTGLASPVAISVLANDTGFVDPVTVTIDQEPQNGTVVVNGSPGNAGSITLTYTPIGTYSGSDSFRYQVSDGINTRTAQVSVIIDAYRAFPDSYVLLRNNCYFLKVAANDVGFTDPVTVYIIQYPAYGSAFIGNTPGPKSEVYAHLCTYSGPPGTYSDTFRYIISDGTREADGVVTLEVVPYKAVDDEVATGIGTPVGVKVLENDVGFGFPATVGLYTAPQNGSVAITGSPGYPSSVTATYTPAPGFEGTDTFEYAVEDGAKLDIARVTVRVILDQDKDLVADGQDNCLGKANPGQQDGDGDGYGNACDGDLDNSGFVNFADLNLFRQSFTTTDPEADFDGNGIVNFADLAAFRLLFGKPPGPSALVD